MEKKGAQVVAISTDDPATQKKFKTEMKAQYIFLSDPGGKVARQYGGLIPILGRANRATFVIEPDRRVKEIITGADAIDPAGAIAACPLHPNKG